MTGIRLTFDCEVTLPKEEVDDCIAALLEKDFEFFRYLADNNAKITPTFLAANIARGIKQEWKKK